MSPAADDHLPPFVDLTKPSLNRTGNRSISVKSEVVLADLLGFQFQLERVHDAGDHHVEADEQNQLYDAGVGVVGPDGVEEFVG